MSGGLVCGAEEPLSFNEMLYAVHDDHKQRGLADFEVPELCRYSFLPVVPHTKLEDGEYVALLRAVCSQLGVGARWLVVWLHDLEGNQKIRNLVFRSQLKRSGWETMARGGLGLALKEIPIPQITNIVPDALDWIITIGRPMDVEAFAEPETLSTARAFGGTSPFAPGYKFLARLAQLGAGVFYESKTDPGEVGLVVVTPQPLDRALPRLINEGVVRKVIRGPAASSVWTDRS